MLEVKFKVRNLKKVQRDLNKRRLRPHLPAIMKAIGEGALANTLKRFEGQVDPQGTPWAPLSQNTRQNKQTDNILQETGLLKTSLNYQATHNTVRIGVDGDIDGELAYAPIHQFGGNAGRNGAVHMPARPFLGVDGDDKILVVETIKDALLL